MAAQANSDEGCEPAAAALEQALALALQLTVAEQVCLMQQWFDRSAWRLAKEPANMPRVTHAFHMPAISTAPP